MAKYIDAEKLKAKIKHLKLDVYDEAHQFDLGARSSLAYLEDFIDSLQQEQPSEGYDEVYLQEKIALKEKHGSWKDGIKQLEYLNKIYFKEQPSEDLEEEIKKYRDSFEEDAVDPFENIPSLEDTARHFYDLGKQSKEPVSENLEKKECELVTADEDIITIHLGKVLTEEQYDAVLRSVIDHLNKHWWHILQWPA